MSTLLELCRTTARKCGIAGTINSAVDQTGEFADVVQWVKDAWNDLQNEQLWNWLLQDFTFNTVIGTRAYTPTTAGAVDSAGDPDLGRWRLFDENGITAVKCYLTSSGVAGEWFLPYLDYSSFKSTFMLGTANSGPPQCFTVRPEDNAILIGPLPSAVYTVYGQYWRAPYTMTANSDTPTGLPTRFHELIPYRAMQHYAEFEEAGTVDQVGGRNYARLNARHLIECLPQIEYGEPMA